MTKPIARDPIYRRRRFESEIIADVARIALAGAGHKVRGRLG
jgi:hypothetical protein